MVGVAAPESSGEDDAVQHKVCGKPTASQRRRAKAKQRDQRKAADLTAAAPPAPPPPSLPANVTIEYVAATPESVLGEGALNDPSLAALADVFKHFLPGGGASAEAGAKKGDAGEEDSGAAASSAAAAAAAAAAAGLSDEEEGDGGGIKGGAVGGLSRRARKALVQDFVAALKRDVSHPEVVEAHDVASSDPQLLVHLKAYAGAVPVPRHWCHKRRYLQGKRGVVKPPFELPAYISATGIGALRELDVEASDKQTLKSKTRDRARPKMGRVEVDYQVLHDAFFIHQTKPRLSCFGDLYYEGKEFEKDHSHFKPGTLSPALREALGMGDNSPPPWLVAQQRIGPPPSYPSLRISGLSAPIPAGASFGYGPGQWGRPPTDERGFPLYGDVFGLLAGAAGGEEVGAGAVKRHWGEPMRGGAAGGGAGGGGGVEALLVEEEGAAAVVPTPDVAATSSAAATIAAAMSAGSAAAAAAAAATLSGTASISGLDTPQLVELRKGARGSGRASGLETPDVVGGAAAPALYTVLEQRSTELSGGLLGTKHVYAVGASAGGGVTAAPGGAPVRHQIATSGGGSGGAGDVAIALAPDDLRNLSEAELAKRYDEEARRAAAAAAELSKGEDVGDLMAEHAARTSNKRKGDGGGGGAKKKAASSYKF